GGPTDTQALHAGSPAIDAGYPGAPGPGPACTATDQRGVVRPQGSACDIGAFESLCGNGVIDVGEQCDDGNTLDGDCCSAACRFETGSCNDGNACTAGDTCLAGVCIPGFPVGCVPADACHLFGTCDPGTGACTNPIGHEGEACDDHDACTSASIC